MKNECELCDPSESRSSAASMYLLFWEWQGSSGGWEHSIYTHAFRPLLRQQEASHRRWEVFLPPARVYEQAQGFDGQCVLLRHTSHSRKFLWYQAMQFHLHHAQESERTASPPSVVTQGLHKTLPEPHLHPTTGYAPSRLPETPSHVLETVLHRSGIAVTAERHLDREEAQATRTQSATSRDITIPSRVL